MGGVKFTRPRDGPVAPPTARVLSSAAAAMAARGRALIAWAAECFLGKENREEDLALAVGEASERARGSGSTPGQAKAPRGEGEHPPPPRSGRVRLGGSHRTAASLSVLPVLLFLACCLLLFTRCPTPHGEGTVDSPPVFLTFF